MAWPPSPEDPDVPLPATVEIVYAAGMPEVTTRLTAFELPPPGAGFVTTTENVPAVPRSALLREMVS